MEPQDRKAELEFWTTPEVKEIGTLARVAGGSLGTNGLGDDIWYRS